MAKAFRTNDGAVYIPAEFRGGYIDVDLYNRLDRSPAVLWEGSERFARYGRVPFDFQLPDYIADNLSSQLGSLAPGRTVSAINALFLVTNWDKDGTVIFVEGFAVVQDDENNFVLLPFLYEL